MNSLIASIPAHKYCWVDKRFISKEAGYERAIWFGLSSIHGRAWGLHVVLECGAIYRGLPPHAIAFQPNSKNWSIQQAQLWDCYGCQFSVHEYSYLSGMPCECKIRVGKKHKSYFGEYLFTAAPYGDGFSREPEQNKEFLFVALDNGRLTIQPTNRILIHDASFVEPKWPTHLIASKQVFSCETGEINGQH